jgi:hypothetical protein
VLLNGMEYCLQDLQGIPVADNQDCASTEITLLNHEY